MYYGDVSIYIAITGLDPEITPELLDLLASYEARACFFMTAKDMDRAPDLVRRIFGQGHTIGLLAESGDEAAEWRAASAALLRHTVSRSLLAASFVGDGAPAESMGLRLCFGADADVVSENGGLTAVEATERMLAADGAETVIIKTDPSSSRVLESVLGLIKLGSFDVRVMLETAKLG